MDARSLSIPQLQSPRPALRADWLRLTAGAAVLVWAGLWTAFVVVDGASDARTLGLTTYLYMLGFLIAFWVPTCLALWRPFAGAIALSLVGLVGLVYFDYPGVRWILAMPPLLLAVAHGVIARRMRRASTAKLGSPTSAREKEGA